MFKTQEEPVEKLNDGCFILRVVQCPHCIERARQYIAPEESTDDASMTTDSDEEESRSQPVQRRGAFSQ